MTYENDRQVYDIVRDHLLTQGVKSGYDNDATGVFTCLYRGHKDTMCAIGVLLTDEEAYHGDGGLDHDDETKALSVKDLLCSHAGMRERFKNISTPLLIDLQDVHDNYPVRSWGDRLEDMGRYLKEDGRYLYQETPG